MKALSPSLMPHPGGSWFTCDIHLCGTEQGARLLAITYFYWKVSLQIHGEEAEGYWNKHTKQSETLPEDLLQFLLQAQYDQQLGNFIGTILAKKFYSSNWTLRSLVAGQSPIYDLWEPPKGNDKALPSRPDQRELPSPHQSWCIDSDCSFLEGAAIKGSGAWISLALMHVCIPVPDTSAETSWSRVMAEAFFFTLTWYRSPRTLFSSSLFLH